jgi:hypothetical protein
MILFFQFQHRMTTIEEAHHIMLISEVIHLYIWKKNTDGQYSKVSIETSDTLSGRWHYNRNNYDILLRIFIHNYSKQYHLVDIIIYR